MLAGGITVLRTRFVKNRLYSSLIDYPSPQRTWCTLGKHRLIRMHGYNCAGFVNPDSLSLYAVRKVFMGLYGE